MNVIVGIDGTEQQHDALALGAQLARVQGDRVTIAYAYPWSHASLRLGPAYARTLADDAQALVATAKRSVPDDVACTTVAIADPSAPRALHRLAQDEHADVIVVGSSHHGAVGRTLLGGVGDRVVHAAPCAVAVAPRGFADSRTTMRRIGVAYDGSPEAADAVGWAGRFAEAIGATVTVFSVLAPTALPVGLAGGIPFDYEELERPTRDAWRQRLDEAVAALPTAVEATGVMLRGSPAHKLESVDVDLFVTGSRGYGPVRTTLLGSVSRAVVRHAPWPVIVLPRGAAEAIPAVSEEQLSVGAEA